MSNFHVGQEVVCVDDEWDDGVPEGGPVLDQVTPKVGDILTIVGFCEFGALIFPCYQDSYSPECFRPVRKTDISIFEAMLTPAPNKKERETV